MMLSEALITSFRTSCPYIWKLAKF